jgi:hypothetical protein
MTRLEAHNEDIQEFMDEHNYKKITSMTGPVILPKEVPLELQTVREKVKKLEKHTLPQLEK